MFHMLLEGGVSPPLPYEKCNPTDEKVRPRLHMTLGYANWKKKEKKISKSFVLDSAERFLKGCRSLSCWFEKPGDAGVNNESQVWMFCSFQITDWSIIMHGQFCKVLFTIQNLNYKQLKVERTALKPRPCLWHCKGWKGTLGPKYRDGKIF